MLDKIIGSDLGKIESKLDGVKAGYRAVNNMSNMISNGIDTNGFDLAMDLANRVLCGNSSFSNGFYRKGDWDVCGFLGSAQFDNFFNTAKKSMNDTLLETAKNIHNDRLLSTVGFDNYDNILSEGLDVVDNVSEVSEKITNYTNSASKFKNVKDKLSEWI